RVAPVEPVVTNSCAFLCTRGRGCNQHPVFPAPSLFRGTKSMQSSGKNASRECETMSFAAIAPRDDDASRERRVFHRNLVAHCNLAAGNHLGIDAAFVVAELAHQRLRNLEVARGSVRIDIGGGATGNPLDHLQSRLADGESLTDKVGLVP